MSNNRSSETLKTSFEEALRTQVAADIGSFLNAYTDPKKALGILSKKTQIHSKTLRRFLQKSHSPGYQTLYKLYAGLSGTKNLNDTLAAAPIPVQEKLRRADPQLKDSPAALYSPAIEEELLNDRVFAELYVLADLAPFDRVFVKQRFGDYGLEVIHRMLDLRVLRLGTDGKLILGPNRASFSAKTIKKVGLQLGQTYLKPERAQELYANHMALYFETLSEKTYRQWVDIDVKAFEDKMACLKEPGAKGPIPAFTFAIVETLKGPADHE